MNAHTISTSRPLGLSSDDRFGRSIAQRLNEAADDLPYDITERLRAARVRALEQRNIVQPQWSEEVSLSGSGALLGARKFGFFGRFAALIPLFALVIGVITISAIQDDLRAREIAEVDSELLTDELPPSAYTDPGFAQYLRANLAK